MIDWKKMKSAALEWGLFFGIVTWLFATAITNEFTSAAVWGMIISRVVMGAVTAVIAWTVPWWIRGAVTGIGVNLLFAALSALPSGSFFDGWRVGFTLMLVTGIVAGILLELAMLHREKQLAAHTSR
ncbi:hypothetical protein JXO52_09965 [bacterium]|nr:hypothetical protein [bacterium]